MQSRELIDKLKQDVEENILFASKNFSSLSEPQFNWKPAPYRWSIAQCIQHINMSGRHYFKKFELTLKKGVKSSGDNDFKPGFLSSYLVRLIQPKPSVKLRTPEIFEPHFTVNGQAAMEEFFELQNHFSQLADRIRQYDLNKNKLKSRTTPLLKLKLGDAFTLVNNHTARHLNQAKIVKSNPKFPAV